MTIIFNFKIFSSKQDTSVADKNPACNLIEVSQIEHEAALKIFESNVAAISMLQRRMKIGYSLAAKIIDRLEEFGIISPFAGTTPRKILISEEEYLQRVKLKDDETQFWPQQFGDARIEYELEVADRMDGHSFEYWCANLLRKNWFLDVQVTRGSGDHGVDIVAIKDGIKYAIQCKCYSSPLGNTPVQEVNTGKLMYDCHVGVVMTNSSFTSGAIELADKAGVLLWDRRKLEEMLAKIFS